MENCSLGEPTMLWSFNFSSTNQPLRKREELEIDLTTNDQWFNQSYLYIMHTYVCIKRMRFQELLVGEQEEVLGGWCIQRGHGTYILIPHNLVPASLLSACFRVSSFEINQKTRNKTDFLSSVSWSRKPEEEVMETLDVYSWWFRSTGNISQSPKNKGGTSSLLHKC